MPTAPVVGRTMSQVPSAALWSLDTSARLVELLEMLLRQEQETAHREKLDEESVRKEPSQTVAATPMSQDAFTALLDKATIAQSDCRQPDACQPCSWHFSPPGCCPRGVACPFCHVHNTHQRGRPCKSKRLRLDKAKAWLDREAAADPASLLSRLDEIPAACRKDPFLLKEYRAYVDILSARHAQVDYSVYAWRRECQQSSDGCAAPRSPACESGGP
mmetsp:Transcript_75164/g.147548  ORF Transcript_75164/g.147548 Transcript_75164/m.147548 type:complete len:217 (-) Transcript_75164:236-886(-)